MSKTHTTKRNARQLQQGDVTLERIATMPKGGTRVAAGPRGYVLAEGEVTGHAHTIAPIEGLELREVDGVLYARIPETVALTHEEHHTVTVPPGVYRVGKVQEYDHFAEEARFVAD